MRVSSFVSVLTVIGTRGVMSNFDSMVTGFRRSVFDRINKLDVFNVKKK